MAEAFWEADEHEMAIETAERMLRLNASDNQGIRYKLVGWYLAEEMYDEAEGLLGR